MGIDQLDVLLIYLYNNPKYQYIQEVQDNTSAITGLEILQTLILLNKLEKDGYITVEPLGSWVENKKGILEKKFTDSYFISFEGVLFVEKYLRKSGSAPYKRSSRHKAIWTAAKLIITILNSVAILYLMWRTIPK